MRPILFWSIATGFVLGAASPVFAQLTAAAEGPIVYGHHHLSVTNIDEQKKFWIDTLGGTPVKMGTAEIIKFPNVLVFLRQQAPTGGTKGTTVNHVGFQVPSVRAMVDKVKAAGYRVVTREEVAPTQEVKDDLAYLPGDVTIAFVMAPDDIKIELLERKTPKPAMSIDHVHMATQQVEEMRAWYVKTFNAKAGVRGAFQAAELPGVALTFLPSPEPVVGTRGHSLDHIGFEVKNLEAFCKKLEAEGVKFDRPYGKAGALPLMIAFFTDPFGTYIELTEGLDKF